jgi:hypothetical protein
MSRAVELNASVPMLNVAEETEPIEPELVVVPFCTPLM